MSLIQENDILYLLLKLIVHNNLCFAINAEKK